MVITCPFCGHQWRPRSEMPTLCCSQCGRKFPRPPLSVEMIGRRLPIAAKCDGCGREMAELNVCRIDGELTLVCSSCLGVLPEPDGDETVSTTTE